MSNLTNDGFITVNRHNKNKNKNKYYNINEKIKDDVEKAFDEYDSLDKIKLLYSRSGNISYIIYTVHYACELDNIYILQNIFKSYPHLKEKLINSKCHTKDIKLIEKAKDNSSELCYEYLTYLSDNTHMT